MTVHLHILSMYVICARTIQWLTLFLRFTSNIKVYAFYATKFYLENLHMAFLNPPDRQLKILSRKLFCQKILICNILTRHLIKNYQAKYFVCWPDAWVIWNAPVPLLHLSYIITSIPDLTSLVRWCCLSHILFGFCTLFANLRFQNIELQV